MAKSRKTARAGGPRGSEGTEDLRATHIVLFRERIDENAEMMAKVMSLVPRNGGNGGMGPLAMGLGGADIANAHIHAELGCASVIASEADVERLRNAAEVEGVFPNEVRTLPSPVTETTAQPAPPLIGLDYLRGLRDGIDQALAVLAAGTRPEFRPPASLFRSASAHVDTPTHTWGLAAIGLTKAERPTGRGVKVAVLDTGIDEAHPDFRDRLITDNLRSFVRGEPVTDGHGHGTHCCGTVNGPQRPNGSGRAYGVAPDATLLVGKVLSNAGRGEDSTIIEGIQWAVEAGARVISMSLGSPRRPGDPYSQLYERIAERLLRPRKGNGTLIVAAAGNESRRPNSLGAVGNPAACPSILSVAAVGSDLGVAPFSSRQLDGIGAVDVAAPGVGVYSSWPGGAYNFLSGTSMATPHVAALAALMFEFEPDMSALEAWDRLKLRARPLGDPLDLGAGLIQLTV